MNNPQGIAYLDLQRFRNALQAGIQHVTERKEYINRINVFPVPDSDTGSNLVFTLRAISDALHQHKERGLADLMGRVADAALDGARGNSGAILAQFLEGFRQGASYENDHLLAEGLAAASGSGARAAWSALSDPVAGTMPTVLQDFADALAAQVAAGVRDIRILLQHGLEQARLSLARTPEQLPALKQAGVVDAGGQGFVDLLEGINAYVQSGVMPERLSFPEPAEASLPATHEGYEVGDHRYCTECLVVGQGIDRHALSTELQALDSSSLVVAGNRDRVRVHIHVNAPAKVFLACEAYGDVTRQKADDMQRQSSISRHRQAVFVVVDSAADLPQADLERLDIGMVPVRLSFGDQDYLDKVSLTPNEFYRKLAESEVFPKTSQPPAGDFARQFELLTSHGREVVSIDVSRRLSGTIQAAERAREKTDPARISVVDSCNGASGQGLLALYAAEAAAAGLSREEVVAVTQLMRSRTETFVLVQDLSWGVRGGRVQPWIQRVADWLSLTPILANTEQGDLKPRGAILGKQNRVKKFGAWVTRKLQAGQVYRILIGHAEAEAEARALRRQLLDAHADIHYCQITDTGPAIGVHLGPGGLVVGIQAWSPVEDLLPGNTAEEE